MNGLREVFINAAETASATDEVRLFFKKQIEKMAFSKDDDESHHFCVYFPAYDPDKKLIFIGHHKKSGLWLVNGGHIEKNETPKQALKREMIEEWGFGMDIETLRPSLLTITEIESNPAKRPCKTHCDIWFFVPQNSGKFDPNKKLLSEEYHESGWKTFAQARSLSKDKNTIAGISEIEKNINLHENR